MNTSQLASLLFTILTFAMLVSGCGGAGKTSASLEIANGFLVSANGYEGGLIVHAKNEKGDVISVPLTSKTSSTIELPNGNWNFRAVGWNGVNGDSTFRFGGAIYCGSSSAALTGGSATVNLSLSTTKCDSDMFASPSFRDAAGPRNLNTVLAVSTLIKYPVLPTDIVSSKIFSSTDTNSVITTALPEDLKSPAKAIRFFALKKDLKGDWVPDFASKCMGGGSNGQFLKVANPYTSIDFRIPSLIPVAVAVYDDTSCGKELSLYKFPDGIEKAPIDGDHIMHLDSSTNSRLVIIANSHRRGYSPFMALLPGIKCGTSGAPSRCRTTPSTIPDYVVKFGSMSERIFIPDVSSCSGITYSSYLVGSCTPSGDGLIVDLDTTNANITATTATEWVTVSAKTYILAFEGVAATDREKKSAFNDLISYIGPDNPSAYPQTFLNAQSGGEDKNRETWGLIGRVREHLSPTGAGSLFGLSNPAASFRDNCTAVSGSRDITLMDEGKTQTFRITAYAPTLAADTYTCTTANADASSCGETFDVKFKVFNLSKSSVVPEITYTLDCDSLIGKMSMKEEKEEDSSTRKHKDRLIVSWNTNPDSNHMYQRYEFVKMKEEWEKDGSTWVKTQEQREMGRVFKTEQDRAQIMAFSFNTKTDVLMSGRSADLESRQSSLDSVAGVACVTNMSVNSTDPSPGDLFSATFFGFRSTAVAQPLVFSLKQLDMSTDFQTSNYGTPSVSCTSVVANKLTAITTSGFNNHKINKTLPQGVTTLGTLESTVFSDDSFLDH